jgi:hypothetical protein
MHDTVLRNRHIGTLTRALGPAMAKDVTNDPAFPTLTQTLALLERTGLDPVESLRQAAQRHELESARSVAKVLNHRLELMTTNDDDPGEEPEPVKTTDLPPRRPMLSGPVLPGP